MTGREGIAVMIPLSKQEETGFKARMRQLTLDRNRETLPKAADRKAEMWATSRNQQKRMGHSPGARKRPNKWIHESSQKLKKKSYMQ